MGKSNGNNFFLCGPVSNDPSHYSRPRWRGVFLVVSQILYPKVVMERKGETQNARNVKLTSSDN